LNLGAGRVAEVDGVGVVDVLAGRGGAPGVVAAAAELHVEVDAGERGAARIDARQPRGRRGVNVLLHQDLRREVGDLRAGELLMENFALFTEPGSGMAREPFATCLAVVSCGKRLPCTVVGASGSSAARKSRNARNPAEGGGEELAWAGIRQALTRRFGHTRASTGPAPAGVRSRRTRRASWSGRAWVSPMYALMPAM
jgi:hypothetical protein